MPSTSFRSSAECEVSGPARPLDLIAFGSEPLVDCFAFVEDTLGPEALGEGPGPAGRGWFHATVHVNDSVCRSLVGRLVSAGAPALVIRFTPTYSARLCVVDLDGAQELWMEPPYPDLPKAPEGSVSAAADQAAALMDWAGWTRLPVRKPPDPVAMMSRVWRQDGGDAITDVVQQMGLSWNNENWWRELPGAVIDPGIGPPRFVGRRLVDARVQRWVVAKTEDSFGAWDREALGSGPVKEWPRNQDGNRQATDFLFEQIAMPIIASTVVDGERWCCGVLAPHSDGSVTRDGMLLHWSAQGGVAVIGAGQRPVTYFLVPPSGTIGLQRPVAEASGLTVQEGGGVRHYEIPDIETAKRIATASQARWEPGEWLPVPDDVEPKLMPTLEWVRGAI
jgi:hypothetical protein